MKIETLITIEKLLQKNVEEKEKHYKKLAEKVRRLEQAQADDPEDYHIANELEGWSKSKLRVKKEWDAAIEAQEDFEEHDWR